MPTFPKTISLAIDQAGARVMIEECQAANQKLKSERLVRDLIQVAISHHHMDCGPECPWRARLARLDEMIARRERFVKMLDAFAHQCKSEIDPWEKLHSILEATEQNRNT